MKLHCIFLRNGCILPSCLDPLREAFGKDWTHVEGVSSSGFDTMIRHAGWHFIWLRGSWSRMGCARTLEAAIDRALARALRAVTKRGNAAEFASVYVTELLGFLISIVTVQSRQIQEHSLMESNY